MAQFDSEIDEVFPVSAPLDVVTRHFQDRQAIVKGTTQAEKATIGDDDSIHFVLAAQQHGPYSFTPDYVVHYVDGEHSLSWTTREGNMVNEGTATFSARADGGTDVRYRCRIAFELPIPRLVAGPLRGVVAKIAQPSIRAYVHNMIASVPT